MKATIEINEDGSFDVEILTKVSRFKANGFIPLQEDSKDLKDSLEVMGIRICNKATQYTQSKATLNK